MVSQVPEREDMKTETKISSIALVCALCAVVAAPAMAAAPVRSLGGAGTYSSASSAATSKATGSSATATRAGAIRVMPSTTKATSTTTSAKPVTTGTATTSTRVAAAPRLSIGKYLPNRVVASTGGTTGEPEKDFVDSNDPLWKQITELPPRVDDLEAGVGVLEEQVKALEGTIGNTDVVNLQTIVNDLQTNVNTIVTQLPADDAPVATAESVTQINNTVTEINTTIEQLQEQITKIEAGDNSVTVEGLVEDVKTLQGQVGALQTNVAGLQSDIAGKQNILTAGNYISIDGDTVSVDVEDLQAYLGKNGDIVTIGYDDVSRTLSWSVNEVPGSVSFGDFATLTDVEDADAELSKALNATINALDARVQVLENYLTAEKKAQIEADLVSLEGLIEVQNSIEAYATAAALEEVKSQLEDIVSPDGTGMVTKTELEALDSRLSGLITGLSEADTLTATTLSQIKENLETNYYTSAQVDALLDGYATNEDLTLVANSIPTKVTDLTDSDNYVTQEQLEIATAAVEAEITKQLEAGNFATAENLGKVSDALKDLEGNVYTKEQVNQKVAEVVGGLSAYVTFTKLAELNLAENADGSYKPLGKVAYLDEIDASEYVVENSITSEMIDSVSADKIEGQLAATQLNAGVELEENQIAMLSVDGDGNQVWVVYTVE